MADRFSAKVGEDFTLDAEFRLDGVLTDVFELDRVEIQDRSFNLIETIESFTNPTNGNYSVIVPALTQGGTLHDVWYYRQIENGALESVSFVVSVLEYAVETDLDPSSPSSTDSDLCELTAKFVDGSGTPIKGVYVKFSPEAPQDQLTSLGFVASAATGQSNAAGLLCRVEANGDLVPGMRVVRGMKGLMTVTHIGMTRRVEIPDVSTIGLFDLLSTGDDLLDVQHVDDFFRLPRRS